MFDLEVAVTRAFISELVQRIKTSSQRATTRSEWKSDLPIGRKRLGAVTSVDVGRSCWVGSPRPHGKKLLTSKCVPSPQIECFHTSRLGSSYSKEGEIATTELRGEVNLWKPVSISLLLHWIRAHYSSLYLHRESSSVLIYGQLFLRFFLFGAHAMKWVQHALNLLVLPGSNKPNKNDPVKQSHEAGYELSKFTQVSQFYTWACSHKRGGVCCKWPIASMDLAV